MPVTNEITVHFTQYMRPNGVKHERTTMVPRRYESKVYAIERHGLTLTCEVLTTGHVSLCIEDHELGDFRQEVVPNGPEVVDATHRLLESFDEEAYHEWVTAMEATS